MSVLARLRAVRDARSVAVRAIREGVLSALNRVDSSGVVVDVGAGRAVWKPYLPETRTYLPFDIARTPEVAFTASATAIPVQTGAADLVLCTEVMEHVPDTGGMLAEISRVLRPGGHLILSVPLLWGVHDQIDFYRWTETGLRHTLAQHGLTVTRLRPRGGIFLALAAIIDQIPFQLLSGDPTRFSDMGMNARARFLASSAIQTLLTPLIWLVASLDGLDKSRRFTQGYVLLARKSA